MAEQLGINLQNCSLPIVGLSFFLGGRYLILPQYYGIQKNNVWRRNKAVAVSIPAVGL
jgi:hypothetical protein